MYVNLSNIKSGFCDKLKKLTLYIAYCDTLKIKKLEIYDRKSKENPFLFYDLCKIRGFKVIKSNIKKREFFNYIDAYNSNPNPTNLKNIIASSSIRLEKNFLIKWKNAYSLIYPQKKTKKFKKATIGIHIRLTDKLVNLKGKLFEIPGKDVVLEKDYNLFKEELRNKIIKKKNCNFFLASDSEKAKNEIISIFKKKKIKLLFNKISFNTKKFRQTNGDSFINDLFCLSQCKKIYSTGGGVPITAKMISKNKINYHKISYQKIFNINIDTINIFLYPLGKLYKKLFP